MATANQTTDQATKGGVLGIVTYLGIKYSVDPALLAMSMPLLAAGLAWASTKIGDPEVAAFFGDKGRKPLNVSITKSPAKKASAKKK